MGQDLIGYRKQQFIIKPLEAVSLDDFTHCGDQDESKHRSQPNGHRSESRALPLPGNV